MARNAAGSSASADVFPGVSQAINCWQYAAFAERLVSLYLFSLPIPRSDTNGLLKFKRWKG